MTRTRTRPDPLPDAPAAPEAPGVPVAGAAPLAPAGAPRRRSGLPAREVPARAAGPAAERAALDLARRIVDLAADKKAADIVLIGIGEFTTVADYLVICSGGSERQLGGIADGIVGALRAEGIRPIGREGDGPAHWLLLDYGPVVVHIFAPPERDFYQLEKLWADAPTLLRVQ